MEWNLVKTTNVINASAKQLAKFTCVPMFCGRAVLRLLLFSRSEFRDLRRPDATNQDDIWYSDVIMTSNTKIFFMKVPYINLR